MKYLLISVFSLFLGSAIFAQDSIRTEQPVAPKQKLPLKEKLYFGGYVNLSFGKYTLVGIEPMVGYKLTPKFSAGVKFRYDYISDKSEFIR